MKMDLALNNQQRLICHKTQTTNQLKIKYTPSTTKKKKKKNSAGGLSHSFNLQSSSSSFLLKREKYFSRFSPSHVICNSNGGSESGRQTAEITSDWQFVLTISFLIASEITLNLQ